MDLKQLGVSRWIHTFGILPSFKPCVVVPVSVRVHLGGDGKNPRIYGLLRNKSFIIDQIYIYNVKGQSHRDRIQWAAPAGVPVTVRAWQIRNENKTSTPKVIRCKENELIPWVFPQEESKSGLCSGVCQSVLGFRIGFIGFLLSIWKFKQTNKKKYSCLFFTPAFLEMLLGWDFQPL